MRAISILKEEHRLILDFLDQLTLAGKKLVKNENPSREFFETAVAFASEFADRYHHHKEEDLMFRMLAQKHAGALDDDLEKLRQQHEQCRNFVSQISDALDGYAQGSDSQTRIIHRKLDEYVTALRQHVNHENAVFFPKASQELSAEELDILAAEYDKFDEKAGGQTMSLNEERLRAMADALGAA